MPLQQEFCVHMVYVGEERLCGQIMGDRIGFGWTGRVMRLGGVGLLTTVRYT